MQVRLRGKRWPVPGWADAPGTCALTLLCFSLACAATRPVERQPPADSRAGVDGDGFIPFPNPRTSSQRLANQIPEYGGAFVDGDGVLNVYLTDSGASSVALEFVRRELVNVGRPDRAVRFIPGEYSYRQLHAYTQALHPYLWPGIAYWGVDDRRNRCWIGFVTDEARDRIEAAIVRLGLERAACILERGNYARTGALPPWEAKLSLTGVE